jgi:hypothetical protein
VPITIAGAVVLSILVVIFFNPLKQSLMKKPFHLGMIASIVFIMSSCSKSAGDLVAKENATASQVAKMSPGNPLSDPIFSSQLSKFYPFINQPEDMQLGDNGAAISTGQLAVFYIQLSPDVANEIPVSATLSTIDDATGQTIETYNLISYRDAGTVDALVPAELEGTPFMLALVHLEGQYTDKTITLSADIQFNNAYAPARLERAFTVVP